MKRVVVFFILMLCGTGNVRAFDVEKVQIHGFVSQSYIQSEKSDYFSEKLQDGTFQFSEIGVNFLITPVERLRLGVQFLYLNQPSIEDDEIEIDWAFGDYQFRNWLGLRAGKLKLDQGLYNQSRDIDVARTCIFLPTPIYNEMFRDIQKAITGIGVYGNLPQGISYYAQYGRVDVDDDSSLSQYYPQGTHLETGRDDTVSLAIEWATPLDGLRLKGTYFDNFSWTAEAGISERETEYRRFVFSAEYLLNNLMVAAEYTQYNIKTEISGIGTFSDDTGEGFYGMVTYRFADWLEMGTYYSVEYDNKGDRDGDRYKESDQPESLAWFKDFAVFSRFDIMDNWIAKVEGHYFDGLMRSLSTDYGDDDGFLFAAKLTFTF